MANYIKLTLLKISNNTRDGALDGNDDDVDDDYDDHVKPSKSLISTLTKYRAF